MSIPDPHDHVDPSPRSTVEREAMLLARRVNRRLKTIREQANGRMLCQQDTLADAPAIDVQTPPGTMQLDNDWVVKSPTPL